MKIKFRGKNSDKNSNERKQEEKYERPEEHMNLSSKKAPSKKKIQPVFGNTSQ